MKLIENIFINLVSIFDNIILGRTKIKNIQISISNNCNYNCAICYDRDFHTKNNKKFLHYFAQQFFNKYGGMPNKCLNMSFSDFCRIIDKFKNVEKIFLIGNGEPFLNADIFKMLNYLRARKIQSRIASNGALLKKDIIEKLITDYPDELQISINGFSENSYKKITGSKVMLLDIVKNIKDILAAVKDNRIPLKVFISSVLCKQTIDEYLDFLKLFSEFNDILTVELSTLNGALSSDFQSLTNDDFEKVNNIKKYLEKGKINHYICEWLNNKDHSKTEILKHYLFPCFASDTFAFVHADGAISQCCESYYPLGNIKNVENLEKIINSSEYKKLRYYSLSSDLKQIIHKFNTCCFFCKMYWINKNYFEKLEPYKQKYINFRKEIVKYIEDNFLRKRKIYQFAQGYYYGDGLGNLVALLSKKWEDKGFDAKMFCSDRPDYKLYSNVFHISDFENDLENDDIAILHYTNHNYINDFVANLKCIKWFYYHNITPSEYFKDYDKNLYEITKLGRENLVKYKNKFHRVLTPSKFNANDLYDLGFKNIIIEPLPKDFELLKIPHNEILYEKFNDRVFNILYVGRILPHKNYELLIDSYNCYKIKYNKKSRLLLPGAFDDESYKNKLFQKIEKEKIEDVHFFGRIEQSDLNALFKVAHLFLCLSEHEGFGMPFIEALFFKLPIIALDRGAVSETLKGRGILVKDADKNIICEKIKEIADTVFLG